jgi:hypothetical protein
MMGIRRLAALGTTKPMIRVTEPPARTTWLTVMVFLLTATYLLLRAPDAVFLLQSNDQGYQMALGMALAMGRLPCLDVITQYGPLVACASWLGFALSGSAVGELCIDALGYAASIALAYRLVIGQGHRAIAALSAVMLLALFPRFYKWYYWLMPLLGISAAQWYYGTIRKYTSTILACWGTLVGVAWLFRYDLGLEGAVFGLLAIAATHLTTLSERQPRWRATVLDGLWFLLMCAVLPATLLALIAFARGREQLVLFLLSIRDGATDSVTAYGIQPFAFQPLHPASTGNVLALQQLAFVAVLATGLVVAIRELASKQESRRAAGFALVCAALTGLGVLPQAFHRADMQHLLQVAPPFVLVLAGLLARYSDRFRAAPRIKLAAGAVASAALIALLAAAVPEASLDLASGWRNPVRYWRTVAGLPATQTPDPVADMSLAIRRLTPTNASIFLMRATTPMPLLFFAERYQAGLFPVYEAGMFTGPVWLAHNRRVLTNAPPDYLVVPEPGGGEELNEPAPFMPDLTAAWLRRYRKTLYVNKSFRLLTRG